MTENDNFISFLQFGQMLIEGDHFGAQKNFINFSVKPIFFWKINETLFWKWVSAKGTKSLLFNLPNITRFAENMQTRSNDWVFRLTQTNDTTIQISFLNFVDCFFKILLGYLFLRIGQSYPWFLIVSIDHWFIIFIFWFLALILDFFYSTFFN